MLPDPVRHKCFFAVGVRMPARRWLLMVAVCCVQARKALPGEAKQQGSGKTALLPFLKGLHSYTSGEPLSYSHPAQM